MSKVQREINDVASQLIEFGLPAPVILLPAMLPDDEASETYARRFDIEKVSPTLWIFYSKHADGERRALYKVQHKTKRITGMCHSLPDKPGRRVRAHRLLLPGEQPAGFRARTPSPAGWSCPR